MTKVLDAVNHLYYNPLIKGGKLPIVGKHQWPTAIAGVPSLAINAAIAAVLGESAAKKLGF